MRSWKLKAKLRIITDALINILRAGSSLEERRLCDASNENTVVVASDLERQFKRRRNKREAGKGTTELIVLVIVNQICRLHCCS